MKGVVLAAGKGTRMLPLTERRPKPLVPVLDRPMLEHVVRGVAAAGVTDLLVIIAYKGDMIMDYFGDGSRYGLRLSYRWQDGPPGTGAATLLAEDFVGGDDFFLCWGDIMVGPETYARVTHTWRSKRPAAILSVNRVADPWEGAAVYVRDGLVERIIEKPSRGSSSTNYNNAGIFMFGGGIFDILRDLPDSPRGEKEMPDAVARLMASGAGIRAVEVEGYWSDVARPASVLDLNGTMISHRQPDGIIIAPSAEVSSATRLTAPVYIGPDCQVGDAELGPNADLVGRVRVGDGASLAHAMCFGDNVIGSGAQVRHVILEEATDVPGDLAVLGHSESPAVLRTP